MPVLSRKCTLILALLAALGLLCSTQLSTSTFPRSIIGVDHDFEELDDEAVIERINHNNPSWTAGLNTNFAGLRVRDVRQSMSSIQFEDGEMFLNASATHLNNGGENGEARSARKISEICSGVNCGSLSCCSGACYNAQQYTCDKGQLCPNGMVSCGRACYNPKQYRCVNGALQLGPEPSTPSPSPSPSPTPSPSPSPTPSPSPSTSNCPPSLSACGIACYNPTQYHCDNGVLKQGPESSTPSPSPSPSPSPAPSPTPSPSPSPAPTPSPSPAPTPSPSPSPGGLPVNFDSRTQWPQCMSSIDSQGNCGGCWAFSAANVLADRICIASNGATKVDLSPQYQINCNSYNMGCTGGYMSRTWTFLGETGTTTEACTPYVSSVDTSNKGCASGCTGSGSFVRYRANPSTITRFSKTDLTAVMRDIMTYGPIHASYYVYSDFLYYKSGVYTHTYGSLQFGHAIRIVGWGTDSASGMTYWICANSWGASWGMNGYFWIRRGTNEVNIEDNLYSGRPIL